MKILVPVKRVLDFNLKVRIKADQSDVDLTNLKMSINPFDEIAVEEAVRLKEKGIATEIIAVTVGAAVAQDVLRTALAMGADRAIHVVSDEPHIPLHIAKILKSIAQTENPDLVLMGKQAIDDDANQTGQMLAALLDWPQAAFSSRLDVEDRQIVVTREVDNGLQVDDVELPAVVTTDLRLNEPRYISLPNIMKAKTKPLQTKTLADLQLNLKPHTKRLKVTPPPTRHSGVMVANVSELMDKLLNEAKVLP